MTSGEPPPGCQVVHWHPEAPPKPAEGAPCNGCGLCCLAEPCPLGMLLTGRRSGPCALLRWDEAARCYRCAAISEAPEGAWGGLRRRLAARWIAAGQGCDAALQALPESDDQ